MAAPTDKVKQRYLVKVGLNYPPGRRAEPGSVVDDIPAMSVAWLLDDGLIEKVGPDVELYDAPAPNPKTKTTKQGESEGGER